MSKRAGRRSFQEAKRIRRLFVRENAKSLSVLGVFVVIIAIAVVLVEVLVLRSKAGAWFAAGAATAGMGWAVWYLLEFDGSRRLRDAGRAEQLTSGLFRKLSDGGWYVVDHIEFAGFDVDHVAVGPAGVFAVETKHTNVPWKVTPAGLEGPYRDPVFQARENSRKIRLLLKSEGVSVPVTPALMLWGRGAPRLDAGCTVIGDVAVVNGNQVDEWLSEFPEAQLDQGAIEAVREVLQRFVERRDSYIGRTAIR
ncbi:MAG TPA: nuclease-related domain-containing protein [Acidimicrobiales bacterium]|nr:nuclease-related domain-containing protein [Acidimicrobiales bacterium]